MKTIKSLTILFLALVLIPFPGVNAQEKRALNLEDIMKFRQIQSETISDNGDWVVLTARPDRGDPEVMVYSTDGKSKYRIERGESPRISGNGDWVAAVQAVPAIDQLKDQDNNKDGQKQGMVLLNTLTGKQKVIERVKSFSFTNDSKWLAYQNYEEKVIRDTTGTGEGSGNNDTGTRLNLLALGSDLTYGFNYVKDYSIDSTSSYMAFTVEDTSGEGNGVFIVDMSYPGKEPLTAFIDTNAWGGNLSWTRRTRTLAFLAGRLDDKEKRADAGLYIWSPGEDSAGLIVDDGRLQEGWKVYHTNNLQWTRDGKRLFFGIKPASEIIPDEEEDKDTVPDLFDQEKILKEREVDVWHWDDPLIIPNQKVSWNREKDRTYTSVYHIDREEYVMLADTLMPDLRWNENPRLALGASNLPYSKKITWDTEYNDIYLVDLQTGERELILEEFRWNPRFSPDGNKVAWYNHGNWYLLDPESGEVSDLTGELSRNHGFTFADEDHDYPMPAGSYGMAGWVDGSEAVMIYDKYDIWQIPSDGSTPVCLTEGKGRKEKIQYRIRNLDRERLYFMTGEEILMEAYHDLGKFTAVCSMRIGETGVDLLARGDLAYTILSKARNDQRVLFTRESYTEFPDIWVTGPDFRKPLKLTDVNPQISEFAWGNAELVEWNNMDGRFMQGVLIKPGNYEPGKKYPVLVYYYRFMSDRLYSFTQMTVNHRPNFPYYASNGYAIFLPDIRFDIGYPGYSATKCLVPGIQKLIDMGIADPDGIALHGHSWSGYQTAFVITRTDIFACAIAGAPVSNMTSAYSGIRLGSGLARQFQYEMSQSRIGGSLWEYPERYIENSPVFFADRINTPLLIMFGDVDDAVPWHQGVELYMAMRRLEKDCVFLQYRNEPHHPRKYANKLDYTIKFKEYLDHYCKGKPAPEWLKKGIPYKGK